MLNIRGIYNLVFKLTSLNFAQVSRSITGRRRKRKRKLRHVEQISFHGADGYTATIHEFMMTTIKLL